MKITKKELRRLLEGIFVGDDDGTVLSPKDVDDLEYSGQVKDDEALGKHPNLDPLLKSPNIQTKKQGRQLAVTLGYQDDLSPYEELAVDHLDSKDIHSPDTPVEHPNIIRDPKAHRIQAVITKDFKNYLTSPELAEQYAKPMFRSISRGHASTHRPRSLMDKLNKISTNTFNEEYMKVIGGQEAGDSFPLALTESELRKLIAEALDEGKRIIVDPEDEAFVASDAYRTGTAKDAQSFGYDPKLDKMKQGTYSQDPLADQRQAREFAIALDLQDELSAGEETAVEMGKQKAMAPDLKFHNELPGTRSIEISKYIKRECQKRGFVCSVEDLRHKGYTDSYGRYTTFIKMFIEGVHPLRQETINAEASISDSWMGGVRIQMHAHFPNGNARSGVLTNRNTAPYFSGAPGYGGLEALAELVVDAVSEL